MSSLNKLILQRPRDSEHSQPEGSGQFSQGSGSSQQAPKVPVLLKRPEGTTTTQGPAIVSRTLTLGQSPAIVTEDKASQQTKVVQAEKKKHILQRTGTPTVGGDQGDRERDRVSSAGTNLYDQLKPYEFPYDKAVPLIHNDLSFKSNRKFLKSLKSTYDYLVVTVIGPPRSGKTTILNYLAGAPENTEFNCEPKIFTPRKDIDDEKLCTFYITPQNIVFIEMAPIFNASAAVDLIPTVDKYSTLESVTTAWNLRLMRWTLSVSHLVIVTSLAVIEPKTVQLIHSAANLQPMETAFGGNSHPELVFVGNKCWLPSESKDRLTSLCSTADIIGFGRRTRLKPNSFLLPHCKDSRVPTRQAYEDFRRKIYEYNHWTRSSFADDETEDGQAKIPQNLTLNDWFTFASNAWEEMANPAYFQDYVRLLH